jgi:hypothetical protein
LIVAVVAYRKLLIPINWPAKPLAERFASIDPSIPLTFLFGTVQCNCVWLSSRARPVCTLPLANAAAGLQHSWIDPTGMFMLQETLPNDIEVIPIHNSGTRAFAACRACAVGCASVRLSRPR